MGLCHRKCRKERCVNAERGKRLVRVHLYANLSGELRLAMRGPKGMKAFFHPPTITSAREYIYDLMRQYPSQVHVTCWGGVTVGEQSEQLQEETVSAIQGAS